MLSLSALSVILINDNDDVDIAIDDNDDEEVAPITEAAANAIARANSTGLPKRAKEYIKKKLRPNIYIGIYYNNIWEEYSPPGLLNILVEEKYYK